MTIFSAKTIHKFAFAASLIVLVTQPVQAHVANSARCRNIFGPSPTPGPASAIHISGSTVQYNANGSFAGIAEFKYSEAKRTLKIRFLSVVERLQGTGISHELMKALLEKFPETQYIETGLAGTNESVYIKAIKSGASPIEALRQTPALKVRKRLGFSRIVRFDEESLDLTVAKDELN